MLASYFDIRPAQKKESDAAPTQTFVPKSLKPPKVAKPKAAKPKAAKKPKTKAVEPYDGGGGGGSSMHAQFTPVPGGPEPRGLDASCGLGSLMEGEAAEEAADPYEYLWQDEAAVDAADEDDTDSCVTFDDAASEATELGTSPGRDAPLDTLFTSRARKVKASEAPVFSGPELWYEEDDFID